jgi:hypothetical protein
MPQVTEKPRQVFLHCPNPVCPGMVQETVDGFEVETAFLFTDNGGDLPFVERSTSRGMVPAEFDTACRHCGANREISLTPRPNYQPLSGADPMGLVGAPAVRPAPADPGGQPGARRAAQAGGGARRPPRA